MKVIARSVARAKNIPSNLGELIAADIKRVADGLGIGPHEVRRSEYRDCSPKFGDNDFVHLGGWGNLVNTFFPRPVDTASVMKLRDIRNTAQAVSKQVASRDIFIEALGDILKDLPRIEAKPYKTKKQKTKTDRFLNVLISDLHIGSDLKAEEVGYDYGVVEEARAVGFIAKTVIEYKLPYRDETVLNVWLNGDMIENNLHGPSGADLTQRQVWRAIWLVTQMVRRFSENFKEVNVYCTTGNHDRDVSVNPTRAIANKFNSLATTIYYSSKIATEHLKNVRWSIPATCWVDANILGHRMRATHSDTFLNIGNPGMTLKMKVIEEKINKINASLKDTHEVKVFLLGHTHVPVVTQMSNGSFVLINGSTQPPTPFTISMDILETSNVQLMFETTSEFAVGDLRFIQLNKSGADSSLDQLIPPWPGLNS